MMGDLLINILALEAEIKAEILAETVHCIELLSALFGNH